MGGFSADWLTLREPADAARALGRADARRLPRRLRAGRDRRRPRSRRRHRVERAVPGRTLLAGAVDALAARRSRSGAARARVSAGGGTMERGVWRRACSICAPLAIEAGELFAGRALVTASALLDLVSERWLHALRADAAARPARRCCSRSRYDGGIHCSPGEPEDATVRELVNRHQRTDKGFGPALGPGRRSGGARAFCRLGLSRASASGAIGCSTRDARDLQRQLIDGWAEAAAAIAPGHRPLAARLASAPARARRRRSLAARRRPRGSGRLAGMIRK